MVTVEASFQTATAASSWICRIWFPLGQRSMKAQQGGAFEDDRGTDHPARSHEEREQAGDNTIRETKIGRPFSRPIEDQQLVFDEHGFGHHGTRAAGTGQSGDRRQQIHKKNGEIAHAANRIKISKS